MLVSLSAPSCCRGQFCSKIALAISRGKRRLKGKEKIGLRVGSVIGKFKMAKHFEITIEVQRRGENDNLGKNLHRTSRNYTLVARSERRDGHIQISKSREGSV
jgi:hypothetical protein